MERFPDPAPGARSSVAQSVRGCDGVARVREHDHAEMPQTQPDPVLDQVARLAAARDIYLDFVGRQAALEPTDFDALCAARPDLADELRGLHEAPTAASLGADASKAAHIAQLLQPLDSARSRARRYQRGDEVGHGGMGAVYRVWDEELARSLAMKVLHGRSFGSESSHLYDERLRRFLREAQITAQLDHPGIVPVHELGLDASERPFFTMKLVQGIDLAKAFALAWNEAEGWNLTRAVNALLKVCEAMAFAHSRGVVHRDLKPANIMVGRFGEVFVMDWGIAHVGGASESVPGVAGAAARTSDDPASEAAEAALTAQGDVLGTAVYMAPEQARGELREIDARTDVYAIGSLLYHLLAKRQPFVDQASKSSTEVILLRLLTGPPESLATAAPDAPPELVSICDKAMAREKSQRYTSMQELAEDLRAYLELRVVRAHERGAWAELKKFVRRNKALTATSGAALVLLVGALSAISILQAKAKNDVEQRNVEVTKEKDRADKNALDAQAAARSALAEAAVSERVTTFLAGIFHDQRPTNQRARKITASELLDQAAAQIRSTLTEDPQVRERLLQAMAGAYASLEEFEPAEKLFFEARESMRARLGDTDATNVFWCRELGFLYLAWPRYDAALAQFRELQAVQTRLHGERDLGVFQARLLGARVLEAALRHAEADAELRAIQSEATAALGAAHPLLGEVAQVLATLHASAGDFDTALQILDAALAVERDDTPEVRSLRATLAELRGRVAADAMTPAQAEAALRQRLEQLSGSLPADDPVVLDALRELAANLNHQHRYDEALRLHQAVFEGRARAFGPASPSTLVASIDVATMHMSLAGVAAGDGNTDATARELAEAEALLLPALAGLRKATPDFNFDLSYALDVLAKLYAYQGRWSEALPLARERLAGLGTDDPQHADAEQLVERIESELVARDPSDTTRARDHK
jgi:serine/threonine protein kinase